MMAPDPIAEARSRALNEFADHIRDTYGQAYPLEAFPEIQKGEISDGLRSRCSASMGRHMAKAIERELREWASRETAPEQD